MPELAVMPRNFMAGGLPPAYRPPVIYTTGQVARICGVAPRTAGKWIDSGKITGYRLPGSKDRRVREPDLIEFMLRSGMLLPPALRRGSVVTFGLSAPTDRVEGLVAARDPFEFGSLVGGHKVRAALIGDDWGRDTALQAARLVLDRHPGAKVVLVVSEDASDAIPFPGVTVRRRPLDWAALVAQLDPERGT